MKKTIIIALTLILVLASFTSCENNIHQHTWDKGTVTKEATCTEAGVITYTCTGCKETETKALEALGHSWDEGVVTEKATYLKKGTKTITCNRCNIVKEEEIPVIPINGSSFIVINGYYSGNLSCMGFEFDESVFHTYNGTGKKKAETKEQTGNEFEVSYKLTGSDTYQLDLDSKTITLGSAGQGIVCIIDEKPNAAGDVEYVSISGDDLPSSMILIPISYKKSLEPKEEGHYYKAECDFKTSISIPQNSEGENTSETTMEIDIKSITFDLYNHIGDYTIVGGNTVGYVTPGLVDWDKCTVCGYEGKGPTTLSFDNTKWTSMNAIVSTNQYLSDINGKKLIIEFNDYPTAIISAKADSDSEPKFINSIIRYDLELNENSKTITLSGDKNIQYVGSISNEDINAKTIEITDFTMWLRGNKVEIGTITFTQDKQ